MAFDDFDMGNKNSFYKIRRIGEIQPDDHEIQILGYAKEVNPSLEFIMTDDTGSIKVREMPEEIERIDEGKLYRILGVHSMDGIGTQFVATKFIQPMDALDLELYNKTIEFKKKFP